MSKTTQRLVNIFLLLLAAYILTNIIIKALAYADLKKAFETQLQGEKREQDKEPCSDCEQEKRKTSQNSDGEIGELDVEIERQKEYEDALRGGEAS